MGPLSKYLDSVRSLFLISALGSNEAAKFEGQLSPQSGAGAAGSALDAGFGSAALKIAGKNAISSTPSGNLATMCFKRSSDKSIAKPCTSRWRGRRTHRLARPYHRDDSARSAPPGAVDTKLDHRPRCRSTLGERTCLSRLGAGLQPMKQERASGGSQASCSHRGVLVVRWNENETCRAVNQTANLKTRKPLILLVAGRTGLPSRPL